MEFCLSAGRTENSPLSANIVLGHDTGRGWNVEKHMRCVEYKGITAKVIPLYFASILYERHKAVVQVRIEPLHLHPLPYLVYPEKYVPP